MKRPEIIEAIRETLKRVVEGDKMTLAKEEAITLPLYELELKTGVSISPIVVLKKFWENRPFKTPFYVNVINEGIVL